MSKTMRMIDRLRELVDTQDEFPCDEKMAVIMGGSQTSIRGRISELRAEGYNIVFRDGKYRVIDRPKKEYIQRLTDILDEADAKQNHRIKRDTTVNVPLNEPSILDAACLAEILMQIERKAKLYDGHYTIFSFTTEYKAMYGTPHFHDDYMETWELISNLPGFNSLRGALIWLANQEIEKPAGMQSFLHR